MVTFTSSLSESESEVEWLVKRVVVTLSVVVRVSPTGNAKVMEIESDRVAESEIEGAISTETLSETAAESTIEGATVGDMESEAAIVSERERLKFPVDVMESIIYAESGIEENTVM